MNEQPQPDWRLILQKNWQEPRHFFFWLALLSPCVVIMAILAETSGAAWHGLDWVFLAAVLGFGLAVPAFVLSWIPVGRTFFTALLRHKLLMIAGLITLVGLGYAVENWRGRYAWEKFQQDWATRGVRFDLESIIPPPVPAEQNFFKTPPWEFLAFSKSNGVIVWKDDEATRNSHVILESTGPLGNEEPGLGSLLTATRIDLSAWQSFYRGPNNSFPTPDGSSTNYFPVATNAQTPARDVILALAKSEGNLRELREAARRPYARFWINYEDGFAMQIPHLANTKANARYLRLRAAALLADGQTDAACDDVLLAFRLNDALRHEPLLISQLVRIATLHVNLLALWDGLADHRWTDAQLQLLEHELAKADFLTDYQTGMDGERACATWTMELLQRTRDPSLLFGPTDHAGEGNWLYQIEETVGTIIGRLAPSGWFDQNKVALGRMHVEIIRPSVDPEKQLAPPDDSSRFSALVQSKSVPRTPYNLFTGMLIPALDRAAKKFANAQTYANLARVACALERHRLASNSYPETLQELAPQFIKQLPHDVINGQPLRYQRSADGQFVLYSVGWNQTDDGGTVAYRKDQFTTWKPPQPSPTNSTNTITSKPSPKPAVNQDEGDWVWRYPAK